MSTQGTIREPGIQPPTQNLLSLLRSAISRELSEWISILSARIPKVQTYNVDLDPASVSANSESTETLTCNGVTTSDAVFVNKPTDSAGIIVGQAWVSAANTVSVKFYNVTGSPIDPGSETYLVVAVRR